MYTIYDYLKYYGEITIDQIKWNVQDNLICSLLSYLPFESFNKKYNLKDFYNINYNDNFKPISIKGLNSLFLPLVLRKLNNEEITENDKIFYHEGFLSKFIEVPNFIINDEVLGHFNKYKNTIWILYIWIFYEF